MRKYELMTIFPLDEDRSKKGLEAVRQILSQFGAEIAKEEPFGDRELTYEIKKQKKGRFVLMNVNANPGKIAEISGQLKLNDDLLKYMFVLIEE
ncbi:MAG: 30S ribosomal protein S6 [Treponema sp.]|nr:30S ribosomal protein S6 [Treponema sp.]